MAEATRASDNSAGAIAAQDERLLLASAKDCTANEWLDAMKGDRLYGSNSTDAALRRGLRIVCESISAAKETAAACR